MGGDTAIQDTDDKTLEGEEGNLAPAIDNEIEVVFDVENDEPKEKEAPKRNPVKDMRDRIKEQNRENKDLTSENATLREALAAKEAPAKPIPVEEVSDQPPTLEASGYDTDLYQQQYAAWNDKQLDKRIDARFKASDNREQLSAADEENEEKIGAHYKRASEFKVADYEKTEDVAVEALGVNIIQAIQTTVDNSETLIYWLGKNPAEAAKLKVQFDANPGKGTFQLGVLSSKLTLRPTGKRPPNPDVPLPGGGGGGGGTDNSSAYRRYYKQLQVAYDDGDLAKAQAVRKEATQDGVKLPFNVT